MNQLIDHLTRLWVLATVRVQPDDTGQTTAEYTLVLVAVAAVVGLFLAWASGGAMTGLFDAVLDRVRGAV